MIRKVLFLLFAIVAISAQAQQMIKGKVVDELGEPLPGVNIQIKDTQDGAISDFDGLFTITVKSNQVLTFSFMGMRTIDVVYKGQNPLNVTLESDQKALDEVVVIGYQTVKKADLTGAVSVLKPESLRNKVVTGTVADALATLPGVTVRTAGNPGAEGKVEIRGTSTFGSSAPLYVVDGIVGGANRDFNFNDIESIQVLKDASAAAIYGSRAANGVIIITTKKGKEGKMVVDASAKVTLQWLPKYDLTDREQWIKLNDLAFANANLPAANHYDANTNWQKEALKTGIVQDYNVSFSGGGQSGTYFISGNYQNNSGTSYGTSSDRITLRSNTQAQRDFGKHVTFRVGENIILSNYKVDELSTNPIVDVWRMLPTIPVYDENNPGGFGYGNGSRDVTFGTNPIARENLTKVKNENLRIRGNVFGEIELFKMLKYRINVGFDQSSDQHMNLRKEGNWTYNQPYDPSSLHKNMARSGTMVYDNTLEFNKQFGKHNISAVAGTSYTDTYYTRLWGTKNNVLMMGSGQYFEQLDAALDGPKTGGYKDVEKLFSVFGRANYNYGDKYIFSVTLRHDKSSKFSPENRSGFFPSISGAWRISQEKFFKVSWIDDLKVRANYGILGSSNIGVWDWVPFINIFPQVVFGPDALQSGMTQVKLVNTDLKWEEQHQMNAGFDLLMLDRRLEISADYFIKDANDVLTPMEILMSTGNNGGNPVVNAASLRNTGVDLSLTWRDRVGDFNYNINVNGSYLKNKIVKLGYDREMFSQWNTKSFVGKPIGEWYLIKTDGLFRTPEDVLNHVDKNGNMIQPDAKPGDVKFIDYNGDGMITDADRQHCGSTIPKFQLGINMGFEYKGLDVMMQFTGAFGYKIFNGPRSGFDRFDDNSNYRADYDPWTPENPNAKDPRPIYGDARNVRGDQDRWLENGNYLRMAQLAIGYSFPKALLGKQFSQLRLFINAQNLFTITKYTGLDPEFLNTNIFERSHDFGAYPNAKAVTFGAQISF